MLDFSLTKSNSCVTRSVRIYCNSILFPKAFNSPPLKLKTGKGDNWVTLLVLMKNVFLRSVQRILIFNSYNDWEIYVEHCTKLILGINPIIFQ